MAVANLSYALLRRIPVLRRPLGLRTCGLVTVRVAWSVGLSVGLTGSHTSEQCKNG